MRLIPTFAALLLVTTSAFAQPAPDDTAPQPPEATQPADAQQQPPPPSPAGPQHRSWREKFDAANTTHDGKLTRDQARAAGLHGIAHHFAQIDTDNKGYVTLQDIKTFRQARRAEKASQQQSQPPAPQQ